MLNQFKYYSISLSMIRIQCILMFGMQQRMFNTQHYHSMGVMLYQQRRWINFSIQFDAIWDIKNPSVEIRRDVLYSAA
ncbi:hypothetical protein HYN46_05425 [Aquirhabdus parva]|uniref:Uncharacterized protein n=1 Tax=Aquirhabdus parva TaxID=2283318 RepID=A0A345P4W6_9GAMM|nr:hypothetical protein HYN46_05425 [Aquirhabdus parva]